jgi:hypothetical protein
MNNYGRRVYPERLNSALERRLREETTSQSLQAQTQAFGLQHNIFENHLRNLLVRNLDEKKKG